MSQEGSVFMVVAYLCIFISNCCFGRMHSVLQTVQCCGDYDRLMQGVYENFLNMSFRDSRLEAVRHKGGMLVCQVHVSAK